MKSIHSNRQKKGSVLIVVIGVLAVLAMMAGAFVSTMTLQKSIGGNVKLDTHAEMAAESGLAHATALISAQYSLYTYTALDQNWFTTFAGTGAATECSDILSFNEGANKTDDADDYPDPDPYPDRAGSIYDGYSKWFEYDNGDGTRSRYTVMTIDLMGRVCTQGDNSFNTQFATIAQGGTSTTATENATKPVFTNGKSLLHSEFIYYDSAGNTLPDDSFLNVITPFGEPASTFFGATHSTGMGPININTAPKRIRHGIVAQMLKHTATVLTIYTDYQAKLQSSLESTFDKVATTPFTSDQAIENDLLLTTLKPQAQIDKMYSTDTTEGGSDAQGLAKAAEMEKAVNDVLNSLFNFNSTNAATGYYQIDFDGINGAVTTAGNAAWAQTPEIFTGKSRYFKVIVRGQVGTGSTAGATWKTISERNLTAVIKLDGSGVPTEIYKRWFNR